MNNNFTKSVNKLISGTLISQLILLFSTPVLTRLYSAEQFGNFALFISIIGVLSVSASLRYNRAIPLPKNDNNAKLILLLGFVIVFIYSTLLFLFLIFLELINLINIAIFGDYYFIYLIPFSVFLIGVYDLKTYWAVRLEKFGSLATNKIFQTVVIFGFQIVLVSLGALALSLGHVLGLLFSVLFLGFVLYDTFKRIKFSTNKTIALAKRYKVFPKYSTWEALFNSFGNNAPVIFFSYFLGATVAGFYALTFKVLSMPINLIGAAIGQVYFAKAAKQYNTVGVESLTLKLFSMLCNLSFAPAILLIYTAPLLFEFVFGKDWRFAGIYAQIMVPWLVLIFISSPLSSIISVSEQQKKSVIFQIVFLISKLGAVYFGSLYFDDLGSVLLLTIVSSLLLVYFTFWILKLAAVSARAAMKAALFSLIFGVICNLPIILQKVYLGGEVQLASYLGAAIICVVLIIFRLFWIRRSFSIA
jgi:O-antigen/teichoic acid export membrane protein